VAYLRIAEYWHNYMLSASLSKRMHLFERWTIVFLKEVKKSKVEWSDPRTMEHPQTTNQNQWSRFSELCLRCAPERLRTKFKLCHGAGWVAWLLATANRDNLQIREEAKLFWVPNEECANQFKAQRLTDLNRCTYYNRILHSQSCLIWLIGDHGSFRSFGSRLVCIYRKSNHDKNRT